MSQDHCKISNIFKDGNDEEDEDDDNLALPIQNIKIQKSQPIKGLNSVLSQYDFKGLTWEGR